MFTSDPLDIDSSQKFSLNQKGIAALVLLISIVLISGGIIGGTFIIMNLKQSDSQVQNSVSSPEPSPTTESTSSGIPVGPETDAFFDSLQERMSGGPTGSTQMESYSVDPCDFNEDRKVDSADHAIFRPARGKKRGENGYNPLIDVDADGVITTTDEKLCFPVTTPASPSP